MNKIKQFYIGVFSKIISGFKTVLNFNKRLIKSIKDDFKGFRVVRASIKTLVYIVLLVIQILLALLLLASYIMCKLTGVCLLLPF